MTEMNTKLRCFFGPLHGKWRERGEPGYLLFEIHHERYILVADGRTGEDVIAWMYDFDPVYSFERHIGSDKAT